MASMEPQRHITGVVVSAGRMINTVKVRIPKQVWNKRLQKYYSEPQTLLVSDPTNSTREGDVVALEGGRRISRHVRHIIAGVIAPMGPPMSERASVPSVVERLAAVEAKRAAKDIRQAARGRWPAIVRIREREAQQAMKSQVRDSEQESPALSLDGFVRLYRRRKSEDKLAHDLVPDFLRVAGYQNLHGEVSMDAQVAALSQAKGKLVKERAKLEQRLDAGTTKQGREIALSEREELSKKKLDLWQQIHQLERSISHFNSYLGEVQPKDEKRKQELRSNPIEWYDLVTILSMSHWEQNIAALDLWGAVALQDAAGRNMDDVSFRAGVTPAFPEVLTDDISAIALDAEIAPNLPSSVRDVQQPELAADAATEPPMVSFEEKELPKLKEGSGHEIPSAPLDQRSREAQGVVRKALEDEKQSQEGKTPNGFEQVESENKEKAGGFWGFFRK